MNHLKFANTEKSFICSIKGVCLSKILEIISDNSTKEDGLEVADILSPVNLAVDDVNKNDIPIKRLSNCQIITIWSNGAFYYENEMDDGVGDLRNLNLEMLSDIYVELAQNLEK